MRVVLMSHWSRRETELPITLASLNAVGFDPKVVMSFRTPSSRENRRVAFQALADADAVDDVLFFEDDVLADHTLPYWVEIARRQPNPVSFCLIRPANHPKRIKRLLKRGLKIPPSLEPVANPELWWGTQAVYLPAAIVEAAITDPTFLKPSVFDGELRWTGWDVWLRDASIRLGLPMHSAFPNPVQHRDPPKLVIRNGRAPQKPRISLTYGHHLEAP